MNFFVCDLERRKYIHASLGGLVDLVMATNIMVMDGKSLKAFVENDESWTTFVNQKFAALDKSHTGKLTRTELQPAVAAVGNAIGLPPMGESAETDHIYDEVINTRTDTNLGHLPLGCCDQRFCDHSRFFSLCFLTALPVKHASTNSP